jgi:hypothetical protein
LARWKNIGVPPTALKARTGEFTPPGMCCCAAAKSSTERLFEVGMLLSFAKI